MFRSEVAGRWPELVRRLDRVGTIARWSAEEPALLGLSRVADLPRATDRRCSSDRRDAVLGALVRRAAADGGDDRDAVLVVLHLLSDGVVALASRLGYRTADPVALVVGELTCQIRSFPWRRRTRCYAANLLLDTKRALWWGELRPFGDGRLPHAAVLVDPLDPAAQACMDAVIPGPGPGPDLDLADVLEWAERNGVAPAEDLEVLVAVEAGCRQGPGSRLRAAKRFGVNERTVRRRRDRALAALRAARWEYLAAVA